MDAAGVNIATTHDDLGRVLTRNYPDNGREDFVYSERGLIRYTNQLEQVTRYGHDAALRRTAETNANSEVTRFSYSRAGDLLKVSKRAGVVYTVNGKVIRQGVWLHARTLKAVDARAARAARTARTYRVTVRAQSADATAEEAPAEEEVVDAEFSEVDEDKKA